MSREPQVGDLVDITIKGVRVHGADHREYGRSVIVLIPTGDGRTATTRVWPQLPAVAIEVVEPATPAAWPPRLGDLWRDRDQELWFGIDVRDVDNPSTPLVELVHVGGGSGRHPAEVNREFGPLTFVRREQTEDKS